MKIRIYQINSGRDEHRVMFLSHDRLERFQGSPEVDSKIYDKVYDREVDCGNLEEVYAMLNLNHPSDYRGRSLSVSDVVEVYESDTVQEGFYFCDSVGFRQVGFQPEECKASERMDEQGVAKISVLLVEPGKYPRIVEIEDSLEAMQRVVGGNIEGVMRFDDGAAIIGNREGKMNGEPLNRAVYPEPEAGMPNKGRPLDIIAGTFFVCYAPAESETYLSLPDELAQKYREKFRYPERFLQNGSGEITAAPYKPKTKDMER